MKTIDNMGKKMPYKESQEYLDTLIARTTEKAISEGRDERREARVRPLMRYAAAAAIAVLLVFAGITLWSPASEGVVAELKTDTLPTMAVTEGTGPIDEFLNEISDDDAQLLAYYEIEDEPEY